MAEVAIDGAVLKRAVKVYLEQAYAGGPVPAAALERQAAVEALAPGAAAPLDMFEEQCGGGKTAYALRLGQPLYPHMKLIVEATPDGSGVIFRADAHDAHLHAPPNSPDAPLLAKLRENNQQVVEKIEAAWAAADVPTFRAYLRKQLAARRERRS